MQELLMLFADAGLPTNVEDSIETCEMAIAADATDKTMAM